jgi:phage FluMu protein Com
MESDTQRQRLRNALPIPAVCSGCGGCTNLLTEESTPIQPAVERLWKCPRCQKMNRIVIARTIIAVAYLVITTSPNISREERD